MGSTKEIGQRAAGLVLLAYPGQGDAVVVVLRFEHVAVQTLQFRSQDFAVFAAVLRWLSLTLNPSRPPTRPGLPHPVLRWDQKAGRAWGCRLGGPTDSATTLHPTPVQTLPGIPQRAGGAVKIGDECGRFGRMTGGTAVFCDQFEAVFDVVVDGVGRELLGWNGLQGEVPPVPEQANPSRALRWVVSTPD